MATQLSLFDDIVDRFLDVCSGSEPQQAQLSKGGDTSSSTAATSSRTLSLAERKAAAHQLCFPLSVFKYLKSVGIATSSSPSSLSPPPLAPFESDSAFLVGKEHVYIMLTWVRNAANLHLHEGMSGLLRQAAFPLVAVTNLVTEALARLVSHVAFRASSMPEPPRLIRVAKALGMTEKEQEALTYLQVCHSGSNFVFSFPNALVPSAVAKYADLSPQEILHFLAEHREHIRQGVVQLDAMGRISLMDSKLTIPQEVVAAFTGESLPEEQLIKLEKTSLAAVLLAERHATGAAAAAPPALLPPSAEAAGKSAQQVVNHESSSVKAAKQREAAKKRGRSEEDASDGEDDDGSNSSGDEYVLCSGSGSSEDDNDDSNDDDDDEGDDEFTPEQLKATIEKLHALHEADAAKAKYLFQQLAGSVFKTPASKLMLEKLSPPLAALLTSIGDDSKKASRKKSAPPSLLSTVTSNEASKAAASRKKSRRVEGVPSSASAANAAGSASANSSPLLATLAPITMPHASSSSATASPLLSNRSAPVFASASASKMNEPYTTDIDYIDDAFKLLSNLIKIRNAEGDMKDDVEDNFYNVPKTKVEATIRELKGKFRLQSHIHRSRIQATLAAAAATAAADPTGKETGFLPRIEQVAKKLSLSEMEKLILLLLVGNVVSHDVLIAINGRYVMRDGQRELNVGYMLFVLCEGLKERVASRRYFYQSAPLIAHGLITVNLTSALRSCFNTDLTDYAVDIDRKIVDYLMGTEMETGEMVPGSKLYTPTVPLENVILPSETTHLVLNTIQHFTLFDQCKRQCGFGEGLGTGGSGLVFLFYGPSGTGKTMLANAVAHDLKKKLLLVNLLQFKGDARSPDVLRFIFREAKLNDAVIFFDECETFFETREANPLVTALLAEFEKYDGIIILATNRAQVIDEAMNRRISLMIEFKLPDHQMRERIWRAHLPKHLPLAPDVKLEMLALDYELSGGLIRNAMLAAISSAVARENSSTPTLVAADFVSGAKRQLRGFFLAAEKTSGTSESYLTTPKRSLDELVVEASVRNQLETVAKLTKSRNTLFSQWGFNEDDCAGCQGVTYLFSGPSGTGKTLAVEGIAYECGSTVRACNVQELLMTSGKEINVSVIFEEARKLGAIVVFDNAQALFDYSDRAQQLSQLIMYHAVLYPRPVIVVATTGGTTNASSSSSSVDSRGSKLQFTEEVTFSMPTRALRKELWKRALPGKVPLSADVDFNVLSEWQVTAKLIKSVCFSVCCKVALLPPDDRRVTMKALKDELEEFMTKDRRRSTHSNMFA